MNGNIYFVSEAPLEIIKAESKKLSGIIDLQSRKFAFSVPLKSFEGFNSALQQEHFHENYMDSELFPVITYTGKLLDIPDLTNEGTYEVKSKGHFKIRNIIKERILKNKIIVKNGVISLESSFTILLSEYNITIPKIVYKKIAEEIQITVRCSNIAP